MAGEAPRSVEIAVVGAGIAGLCTALYLAREGREVAVLERSVPWSESSGANAGTLALQVKRIELMPLGRHSLTLWRELSEEMGLDLDFAQPGGLRVATTDEDARHLKRYSAEQRAAGFDTEWLDGNALHDRAPWLGPEVRAATYFAEDAYSSPLRTGPALMGAVARAGGGVVGHAEVRAIEAVGGGYRLETAAGPVDCHTLVIAAGVWARRLARMIGFDFPLYVDVNMLSVTEPAAFVLDRVVTHIAGTLSVKQLSNGTCLIGGGWQGRGTLAEESREVDYENLVHNLRLAVKTVPRLAELRLARSWAGYEAVAPDALPMLGAVPGHTHAYLATAVRGGYHQGPSQADAIAHLIQGRTPPVDITPFAPGRFGA